MSEPIIIVGAGPVGLSLALALCRRQIPVMVFERAASIVKEVRASTFHPATMEKMRDWGVIDAVLARGQKVEHLQFWDRAEKRIVGDFDYRLIAKDTPYPFRLQCPQHIYAETLLDHLRREPLASIHFEHELVSVDDVPQHPHILAHFKTPTGLSSVQGSLVCGADGANSTLRRHLGLGFEGMTYEDMFLLIGTSLDLDRYYPGIAPVSYIFDPEEWVITLKLADIQRIVFQVPEGLSAEAALADSAVRKRLHKFLGEEVDVPILSKSIYRVHQRVADTFRVGRALLLGDAAHINNPASGMGMNSGILDAAMLCDEITRYHQQGDSAALDRYSEARRRYALDKIKSYTKERYADLTTKDSTTRQLRNQRYHDISRDPSAARSFLLKAAMLDERLLGH